MSKRFDGQTGRPLVQLTPEELKAHIRSVVAANDQWLRQQLPRSARVRLWFARHIDGIAIWLLDQRRERTAMLVWRTFRMI